MAQPDHPETENRPVGHRRSDRESWLDRWHHLPHVAPDKIRRDADQIIDPDAFDWLVDIAEDIEDRRELAAALADDDYVPWEDVKAELGLE